MTGTPDRKKTISRKTKEHNDNINQLWRKRGRGSRTQTTGRSLGSGRQSIPTSSDNFIKKDGDTLQGGLGEIANTIIIANNAIDIAPNDNIFLGKASPTVFLQPETGTADNLIRIDGNKQSQQQLWIRGVNSTVTNTLVDATTAQTAWVISTAYSLGDLVSNGGIGYSCKSAHTSSASDEPGVGASWEDKWHKGNIATHDGNDFAIAGKKYYRLVYDVADEKWVQTTTLGSGGLGLTEPLLYTITTITPQTLPTKTNIDSSLTNVFEITLDRNIEFDIVNPTATKFEMLHIVITQDATGNFTVTWPSSVNGTPTIDLTALSETTVSLFNMGDGVWRFVSTKGGTINVVGATKQLDNLVSPVLNTSIDFNSNAPTNFPGFTNAVGQALAVDGNGVTWDMPVGDSYKHRINGVNIAEITSVGLAMAGTIAMGENYITLDDISTPANPGTGARRLFVDTATGELSVRTAGGSTVSLEATSGDLWGDPVDADILPDTDSLRNIGSNDGVMPKQFAGIFTDVLRFDQSSVFIKKNTGTGDLELNVDSGDQISFILSGTPEWFISSSKLDGSSNTLRCGLIEFSTSVNHSIQASTAGLQYFIPTADTHNFKINSVDEFVISASNIDIQGNDLTLNTNQLLSTDAGGIRYKVPTGDSHDFQINSSSTMALSSSQLSLVDGLDLSVGTTTGTKIGTTGSAKLGFFGVTPVVQRTTYTVTNHVTDRTYDANSTSVDELADVLGTLIVDLKSLGLIAT